MRMGDQLSRKFNSEPMYFWYSVLAALYMKGVTQVTITKEQLEDELATAVDLEKYQDFDTQGWTIKWKVRGLTHDPNVQAERDRYMSPETAEATTPLKPYPWKGFIVGAIVGIIVHLFDRWWLL